MAILFFLDEPMIMLLCKLTLLLYICSNTTPVYNSLYSILNIIRNSTTHIIIIIPTCSRALSCAELKFW